MTDGRTRYDVEELLSEAMMWRRAADDAEDPELRERYLRLAVDRERLVSRSTTVPAVALRLPKGSRFVSLRVADELRGTLTRGGRSEAMPVKVT